jgi:hypothetical protein
MTAVVGCIFPRSDLGWLSDGGKEKAMITAEIARIKAADKEREKKHNQKFKGFLNRKPAT